jgi:hypothetical protein
VPAQRAWTEPVDGALQMTTGLFRIAGLEIVCRREDVALGSITAKADGEFDEFGGGGRRAP